MKVSEKNTIRAKNVNLYDEEASLVKICNALSDPSRRKIVKLINEYGTMTISDIARQLNLPTSNASYHINSLINAGILICTKNTKTRGNEKHISLGIILFNLSLGSATTNIGLSDITVSQNIPIGSYSNFSVTPPCGMTTDKGIVFLTDTPITFYSPNRFEAGIIWMNSGYLEYSFPLTNYMGNELENLSYLNKKAISSISFSFELCSEAPAYNHDFKSDITFSVNGIEICTFTSNGDYGDRKGKLNPDWMGNNCSQYGLMYNIDIRFDGSYINEQRISDIGVDDLDIIHNEIVVFRIEVKDDAKHVGGFNLFGKNFGDYPQDISVNITYLADRLK